MAERKPLDLEAIKVRQRMLEGQLSVRDIAALIAEVERLREERDGLLHAVTQENRNTLAAEARADRLTAVVEAARNHVETRQPHTWSALRQALNALQESDSGNQ